MGNTDITSDDRKYRKDHQRNGHDFRGLVDVMGDMFVDPGLTKEGHEQSPEHIEGSHAGSDCCDGPQQPMAVRAGKSLPEDLILAEKSGEAGNPSDGQCGDEESPERIRDLLPEGSHLYHIQFATQSMHHTPGAEEEESLKERMRHQMKYS